MSQFSGRRLRDIRKQRRLSREQLCVRVGTSICTITRYEQGRTVPSVNAAAALADALDVEIIDMLDSDPASAGGAALWAPRSSPPAIRTALKARSSHRTSSSPPRA